MAISSPVFLFVVVLNGADGETVGRSDVTLDRAIGEVIQSKVRANRRHRYIQSLRQYLCLFAKGRGSMPVSGVRPADLEAWFAGRREAPVTRAANLGRLSALFSFCIRQGYIRENPCRRVERIALDDRTPAVLTPKQARVLLRFVARKCPKCLAYFVLALFAGVRPEEIEALTWDAVDTHGANVVVSVSKCRRRRIARLEPAALAWLKLCSGPLCPSHSTIRRVRRRVCRRLRLSWQQDILRHSAASYLLALHGDEGKVAQWLGNSPRMLHRHYKALVSSEQCSAFWAIYPKAQFERDMGPEGI